MAYWLGLTIKCPICSTSNLEEIGRTDTEINLRCAKDRIIITISEQNEIGEE